MEEVGKIYGWIGTHGFWYGLTLIAITTLPNPLSILWIGFVTIGSIGSYFERKKQNGK
tara:strand:- start:1152 stop:1325 length:174 start_codon:yes stop_codon:yes gene_type:complete